MEAENLCPDSYGDDGTLIRTKGFRIVRDIIKKEWDEDIWEKAYKEACEEVGIDKEGSLEKKWQPLSLDFALIRNLHKYSPEDGENYSFVFEIGRKNAERALSTSFKFLTKILSIENVLKTVDIAWSQYYTRGVMSVEKVGDRYRLILKNLKLEHPYDYYLCGYFTQITIMLGGDVKRTKHADLVWEGGDTRVVDEKLTKCTAEGDEEGVFVLEMDEK